MLLVCLWYSNSVLRWSVFWLMLFVCLWCSHSVLRWSVFWLMLFVCLWCSNSALRSSVFWLMLFVCLWCSNSVLRSSLFWLNSTLLWKMVIFLSIHVNCHEWLINFVHTLYYVEIVWFNFSRTFQGNNRFETSIHNKTHDWSSVTKCFVIIIIITKGIAHQHLRNKQWPIFKARNWRINIMFLTPH